MTADNCKVLDKMKANDKFMSELLAPFEKSMGMKFNEFVRPEDPKYQDPKKKKNLKLKLQKAEKKQEKLKKLTPEQAREVHWKSAMNKARGVKVQDDPKLIKKAIKRKDDEKKRHRKKWSERVERLDESKRMKEKKKKKSKMMKTNSKSNRKSNKGNKTKQHEGKHHKGKQHKGKPKGGKKGKPSRA